MLGADRPVGAEASADAASGGAGAFGAIVVKGLVSLLAAGAIVTGGYFYLHDEAPAAGSENIPTPRIEQVAVHRRGAEAPISLGKEASHAMARGAKSPARVEATGRALPTAAGAADVKKSSSSAIESPAESAAPHAEHEKHAEPIVRTRDTMRVNVSINLDRLNGKHHAP
jgi:hypothetical protein